MTTICPVNNAKRDVRSYLGKICRDKGYTSVFTLLGTEGGLLPYLSNDCKVTSAERDDRVYRHQLNTFKDCLIYKGQASEVLLLRNTNYDFIWLDFFGHCMDSSNLSALIQAVKKLNAEGTIAVTSKDGRRKNKLKEEFIFKSMNLKLTDKRRYENNGNYMKIYILSLNN